jgi:hypothetical protein
MAHAVAHQASGLGRTAFIGDRDDAMPGAALPASMG